MLKELLDYARELGIPDVHAEQGAKHTKVRSGPHLLLTIHRGSKSPQDREHQNSLALLRRYARKEVPLTKH